MGTPAKAPDRLSKVVVGFLNGSRIKGYAYDFSALKESFNLLPYEEPHQGQGTKVEMKDPKALFFVKDFSGSSEYHEPLSSDAPMHGRKIEVLFTDGEKIVGRTEGYNPQRLGSLCFSRIPRAITFASSWSPRMPAKSDLSELFLSDSRASGKRLHPAAG
jgi:hypothetical protein